MPTMRLVPACTSDYRLLAEQCLPRTLFDYIDGGAYSEVTLAANVADFEKIALKQRVLRDVSQIDTHISLFGDNMAMPVALAPIGMAGMMARRAETQAVRAAEAAGVPFTLSTVGICSIEEVAKAATKPFWFQLYMMKDRGCVREILDRAKAAGCKTLLFTVDLPVAGARYRDVRNGMGGNVSALGKLRAGFDYAMHAQWAYDVGVKGKPLVFGTISPYMKDGNTPADFKRWVDAQFDASVTWKDIEWLREYWQGDLIIKGVLSPEDALAAAGAGADAIVVSNHGGRQLDGVSSSIEMTPRIVDAIDDRLVVLMDGGVRSGLDVIRAIASGARAVLIGRPWIWAMGARGGQGVRALLSTFKSEMNVAMALTGVSSIGGISADLLDRS